MSNVGGWQRSLFREYDKAWAETGAIAWRWAQCVAPGCGLEAERRSNALPLMLMSFRLSFIDMRRSSSISWASLLNFATSASKSFSAWVAARCFFITRLLGG